MSTAYVIVTAVGAALVAFSAVSIFVRAAWVMKPLADYGIGRRWLPWLGAAKAAGAVGLAVGIFVPPIAVAASIGLIVYFTGAVVTVLRARWYSHVPFPLIYVAPVIASLAIGLAA